MQQNGVTVGVEQQPTPAEIELSIRAATAPGDAEGRRAAESRSVAASCAAFERMKNYWRDLSTASHIAQAAHDLQQGIFSP